MFGRGGSVSANKLLFLHSRLSSLLGSLWRAPRSSAPRQRSTVLRLKTPQVALSAQDLPQLRSASHKQQRVKQINSEGTMLASSPFAILPTGAPRSKALAQQKVSKPAQPGAAARRRIGRSACETRAVMSTGRDCVGGDCSGSLVHSQLTKVLGVSQRGRGKRSLCPHAYLNYWRVLAGGECRLARPAPDVAVGHFSHRPCRQPLRRAVGRCARATIDMPSFDTFLVKNPRLAASRTQPLFSVARAGPVTVSEPFREHTVTDISGGEVAKPDIVLYGARAADSSHQYK